MQGNRESPSGPAVGPVAAAWWLGARGWVLELAAPAAGLAAVAGHCFPVWLRFRGGKGVATALGAFLVIDPLATLVSVIVFALSFAIWRIASVGSLLGAAAMPVALWLHGRPLIDIALAAAVVAIIVLRHRENLTRLGKGDEQQL